MTELPSAAAKADVTAVVPAQPSGLRGVARAWQRWRRVIIPGVLTVGSYGFVGWHRPRTMKP